jgi:hypothetical protein
MEGQTTASAAIHGWAAVMDASHSARASSGNCIYTASGASNNPGTRSTHLNNGSLDWPVSPKAPTISHGHLLCCLRNCDMAVTVPLHIKRHRLGDKPAFQRCQQPLSTADPVHLAVGTSFSSVTTAGTKCRGATDKQGF